MVLVDNLPNIENNFNILIPMENPLNKKPESITIAFFDES